MNHQSNNQHTLYTSYHTPQPAVKASQMNSFDNPCQQRSKQRKYKRYKQPYQYKCNNLGTVTEQFTSAASFAPTAVYKARATKSPATNPIIEAISFTKPRIKPERKPIKTTTSIKTSSAAI